MNYMQNRISEEEREAMKPGTTYIAVRLLEFFDEDGEPMRVPTKKLIGRYHSEKEAYDAVWSYRFDVLEGADGDFQFSFYEVQRERSEKNPTYLKAKCYECYMI